MAMASAGLSTRRLLRPGWPLYVVFLGYPLWWTLGMAGFIWPIVAFPMLLSLLRRPRILLPRGFGLWLAFVVWMLATGTQLDSAGRMIGFVYRGSLYVSATIVALYVFNSSSRVLHRDTVVGVLATFWIYVVIGGFLGVLFPNFSFRSPVEAALPGSLLSNDFVRDMVHPAFAQIQEILGYPVPRPSAPFVYTNDWGANFALLVPFVIVAWGGAVRRRLKLALTIAAIGSLIPVAVSLNRGLWLSLGVGLAYAGFRMALRGSERAFLISVAVVAVMAGAILLTPLKSLISDRLETPHSNDRRVSLYEEAIRGAAESPLFGYGAPRPSKWNPNAPSVGTQGQIWLVLFSHGFPGALFFLGWFVFVFWRFRRATDPIGFWCHVDILILMVQLIVYGMLPMQLHIVMIGIALASRERRSREREPAALPPPERVPVGASA